MEKYIGSTGNKYGELRDRIAKMVSEWKPIKPELSLSHSVYPVLVNGKATNTITVKR